MWVKLLDSRVGDNFSQAKGEVVEVPTSEGESMIAAGLAIEAGREADAILESLAEPEGSGPSTPPSAPKAVEAAIAGSQDTTKTTKRPRGKGGRKPKETGTDAK